MHENRHFLSYRKRRHDAENHVHIYALRHSGEWLQNGQQPQGNRLGKKIQFESPRMKLRRHCQQLGLCLFPPCYFIFLEPCQVRGVSVFFVVYSSFHNRLDLIREPAFYWVFYFPILSLFVSSYVKVKKFCSFQFNRLAISWPPWVRVWGWASYRFLPFTVFPLACPFVSRVISFIYDVRVRGVVSMFNDRDLSFFLCVGQYVSVCCPAVLLSLLSGLYHVHGLCVSSHCPIAR